MAIIQNNFWMKRSTKMLQKSNITLGNNYLVAVTQGCIIKNSIFSEVLAER